MKVFLLSFKEASEGEEDREREEEREGEREREREVVRLGHTCCMW